MRVIWDTAAFQQRWGRSCPPCILLLPHLPVQQIAWGCINPLEVRGSAPRSTPMRGQTEGRATLTRCERNSLIARPRVLRTKNSRQQIDANCCRPLLSPNPCEAPHLPHESGLAQNLGDLFSKLLDIASTMDATVHTVVYSVQY